MQENSSYKGSGGLTLKMRKWLVSTAWCAIRMRKRARSQECCATTGERPSQQP